MDPNRTTKFRPQQFNPLFKLRHPYKMGRYNWIMRLNWSAKNYLHHVLSVLHYRSSHAPYAVRKKHIVHAKRFEVQHRRIL